MESTPRTVLTVGHSTHTYERFLQLIKGEYVTAIGDVRTSPFSRHQSHFNKDVLQDELKRDGITYVFLGKELGGRPKNNAYFSDGVADYEKMATSEDFTRGIDRVVEGARKYRVALMCSEHDPLDCHRCLLVSRALASRGIEVKHLLASGEVVTHDNIEDKLLKFLGDEMDDLFAPRSERLAIAYRERSKKVAYTRPEENKKNHLAAE